MKHSESIAKLAFALVRAQAEMKAVVKDSTNPAFKSSYASLEATVDAVRPVLARHGLAVMQGESAPETDEGRLTGFNVETVVLHESGEWIANAVFVPVEKPSAQGAVSALTYGRRAGLRAAFTLADTDDDGETAQNHAPAARPAVSARPAAPPSGSPAPPKAAPAKAGTTPPCPKCGGAMWDNRKENAERVANGQKARPAFACKDKAGCGEVVWKESVEPQVVGVGASDDDENRPFDGDDDLPF